ncbi:MAG: photosynthetic reaction center cytochrome c subunit, partial [Betaproteobacteria bacterium]|nr:photosynthetic reaction center cytochrome c subunit [Betaproteobacteria bacterium]
MKRFISPVSVACALALTGLLAGCERPPVEVVQHGYRGTGMEEIYNPRTLAEQASLNAVPEAQPPASPDGPKAGAIYQNVKVLGGLSVAQFARVMVAMTNWVAPKDGCVYCHNAQNFSEDTKYTKVVARRMLQMTEHLNTQWQTHVGSTGVTCYTCHRGNHVPQQTWFEPLMQHQANGMLGNKAEQNSPALTVALASLPYDPFTPFLAKKDASEIRVIGHTALPSGNRHSEKQAEWTYALMMHMSKSLGVNCTYCHNTRSFAQWDNSTPQRVTAWYGIRMVR